VLQALPTRPSPGVHLLVSPKLGRVVKVPITLLAVQIMLLVSTSPQVVGTMAPMIEEGRPGGTGLRATRADVHPQTMHPALMLPQQGRRSAQVGTLRAPQVLDRLVVIQSSTRLTTFMSQELVLELELFLALLAL
jgi:hypothetical protein